MNFPSVQFVKQLAQARLREAVWSVAIAVMLTVIGLTAAGLGMAAGIVATAERIGLIHALLAWAGGLLAIGLVMLIVRQVGQRRRRIQALERAASRPVSADLLGGLSASLMSNSAFKAGMEARNSISPLGAVAAAFALGALIAGTKR